MQSNLILLLLHSMRSKPTQRPPHFFHLTRCTQRVQPYKIRFSHTNCNTLFAVNAFMCPWMPHFSCVRVSYSSWLLRLWLVPSVSVLPLSRYSVHSGGRSALSTPA